MSTPEEVTDAEIAGPFVRHYQQGGWTIEGPDGVDIARITGRLFDGSGRRSQYPDGVIRTEEQRDAESLFVVNAMNKAWASGDRIGGATRVQHPLPEALLSH